MKKIILLTFLFSFSNFSLSQADWGNCLGDIWILVDVSGSETGYESSLNQSVEIIANGVINSSGSSRVALISFDSGSNKLINLTRKKEVFDATKIDLKAGGGTNLATALVHAKREINNSDGVNEKKVLIVISDGNTVNAEWTKFVAGKISSEDSINIVSVHVGKKDENNILTEISTGRSFNSDLVGLPDLFRKEFTCF